MIKYVIMKVLGVAVAATSQILLKKSAGMEHKSRIYEYLNIYVIFGYGLLVLSTLFSIFALKGITLALSMVIESLNYILIPIASKLFLNEKMNQKQYIGMMVIVVGAIVFNINL